MADEELSAEDQELNEKPQEAEEDERPEKAAYHPGAAVAPRPAGFFSIYKSGQGYWTRMGTAAGVALIVLITAAFIRERLASSLSGLSNTIWWLTLDASTWITIGVLGVFLVGVGLWLFHLLNKPTVADFLIATESEMKKVNWTTRKELIGSTKVVILFMFILTLTLFVIDYFFAAVFKLIGIL